MTETITAPVFESDVDESIYRNNYKLTADKIIQILDGVRNEAKKSRRRWIWELMQNAKDVPNRFNKVSVKIHLTKDQLVFSHNGDAFDINNITGLIQQVSSKPSDSSDEETTGKFGTGFISTHLLSDVIKVQGVVKRPNGARRQFEIELDRTGVKSEDLIQNIEDNLKKLKRIDLDEALFPPILNYEENRKEDQLDTTFIYTLKDPDSQNAALVGIKDLIHTLPCTMVNVPKIKQVHVINEVDQVEQLYSLEKIKEEGHISYYKINIESPQRSLGDQERSFVAYSDNGIRLLAEVSNFDSLELIVPNGKQPNLYRDFPLVGTERFHFPFVLNGLSFFPTEKRDGILLNDNREKAAHNKSLLENAKKAAITFTDWLIENKATNLFVLANTRLPDLGVEMEDSLKTWYKAYQSDWRKQLLERSLVEVAGGRILIKEAYIPCYSNISEENMRFWSIASRYYGLSKVPQEKHALAWINAMGVHDELETWGCKVFVNHKTLLGDIQSCGNLESLPLPHVKDRLPWLNDFYSFINTQKELKLLSEYNSVPNQYDVFNKLSELRKEKEEEHIPDEVLDILKTLGVDWRKLLIHRSVRIADLVHAEYTLLDASTEINKILAEEKKESNIIKSDFLSRSDAKQVLINILQLITKDSGKDSFRYRLFEFAKQLLGFEEGFREVKTLENFSFGNAARLMGRLLNQSISGLGSIGQLGIQLQKERAQAIDWLDKYLNFLDGSKEYSFLLKDGNIVPNRHDNLCAYEDLCNYGTPERPLDAQLIGILKDFKPNNDWMSRLVADRISLVLPKTLTFDELGNEIMSIVAGIHSSSKEEEYRNQLLSLIDWCNSNHRLAELYLAEFVFKATRIFFILTVERSPHSSQVVKLLKDTDKIADLAAIAESGVDLAKLKELVAIAGNIDIMAAVVEHAKVLEEEKHDFDFKHKIGVQVEDLFRTALESEGIPVNIRYQGSGAKDFVLTNPNNNKEFFIEIKSYKDTNTTEPIRMAISQAQLATKRSDQYALCIIPRPTLISDVDTPYIRTALRYLDQLKDVLGTPVSDYMQLKSLITKDDDISLELKDPTCKVRISHTFISVKGKDFQQLIQDIKSILEV